MPRTTINLIGGTPTDPVTNTYPLVLVTNGNPACPITFQFTTFDLSSFGGGAAETFGNKAGVIARMNVLNGVAPYGYIYDDGLCALVLISNVDPPVTSEPIPVDVPTFIINVVTPLGAPACPINFTGVTFDMTPYGGQPGEVFADGAAYAARMNVLNPAGNPWVFEDNSATTGECRLTTTGGNPILDDTVVSPCDCANGLDIISVTNSYLSRNTGWGDGGINLRWNNPGDVSYTNQPATIDWGDGSPIENTIISASILAAPPFASHIYADGTYIVTVTTQDDLGNAMSSQTGFTIDTTIGQAYQTNIIQNASIQGIAGRQASTYDCATDTLTLQIEEKGDPGEEYDVTIYGQTQTTIDGTGVAGYNYSPTALGNIMGTETTTVTGVSTNFYSNLTCSALLFTPYTIPILDGEGFNLCPVDFATTVFDMTPYGGGLSEGFETSVGLVNRMNELNIASNLWTYVDDSAGTGECRFETTALVPPRVLDPVVGTVCNCANTETVAISSFNMTIVPTGNNFEFDVFLTNLGDTTATNVELTVFNLGNPQLRSSVLYTSGALNTPTFLATITTDGTIAPETFVIEFEDDEGILYNSSIQVDVTGPTTSIIASPVEVRGIGNGSTYDCATDTIGLQVTTGPNAGTLSLDGFANRAIPANSTLVENYTTILTHTLDGTFTAGSSANSTHANQFRVKKTCST